MKWFGLAVLFIANACCCAAGSGDFQPATTNVWGAQYPSVDAEGRAEIRVNAPDASRVQLSLWGGQKLGNAKQSAGSWTVTTPPLVPG